VVALDTSSFIAYLAGQRGADTEAVDTALESEQGVFPPIVLTELLSGREVVGRAAAIIMAVPQLAVLDGYWLRAGNLRAGLLRRGLKAGLADSLIAQSCLDHDVALITRDRDFRNFARHTGLRLV
jgi:predicted nucleic acid-binding protein